MLGLISHPAAAALLTDRDRFEVLLADQGHATQLLHLVEQGFRSEGARWSTENGVQHAMPVRLDEIRELIATPANRLLVALDRNTVVGTVLISRLSAQISGLGLLGVDAACRGRGLGTYLIEAAETKAVEAFKSQRIELCVQSDDAPLFLYYERRGYRRTGEHRDYTFRNTAAAFGIMTKALAAND